MEILRRDLENKERCEVLADMKLDDIGVGEEEVGGEEIRAATKEYCVRLLHGWPEITADAILTEYYDSLDEAIGAFAEGYEACLKKQLALQPA